MTQGTVLDADPEVSGGARDSGSVYGMYEVGPHVKMMTIIFTEMWFYVTMTLIF